jgi:hypothetical protein
MLNLLSECRTLLEQSGYRTTPGSDAEVCYFEDDSIAGAIFIYEEVATLLEWWERRQDAFLTQNARPLRQDPIKAWNIYTVHLTQTRADDSGETRLFNIEHDFRGTRKIARAGIAIGSDVVDALLPLMPLQRLVALTANDLRSRAKQRLTLVNGLLAGVIDHQDIERIASAMMEER